MLFHWTPTSPSSTSLFSKKGGNPHQPALLPTLSYWVCGRLLDHHPGSAFMGPNTSPSVPTECYVAYHDSAPQNMIELAFRIAFGIHV